MPWRSRSRWSPACATARGATTLRTALATAKELITVKGGTAIYEPIVPGVIEQAKTCLSADQPDARQGLNEVAANLRAEYAARGAELVNEAAKLYASRFTEQELKERSPSTSRRSAARW